MAGVAGRRSWRRASAALSLILLLACLFAGAPVAGAQGDRTALTPEQTKTLGAMLELMQQSDKANGEGKTDAAIELMTRARGGREGFRRSPLQRRPVA
ncbi:MAG: hypothetical protein LC803_01410 [Acidobacteria bacterium]|nr:hypothetical protein [Acidobacteriota bacterium]